MPWWPDHAALRTLTVARTCASSRANTSMSASVLNRSIRPRSKSLTRGCVTPRTLAADFCLSPREVMSFCNWIMRSARTSKCSASSRENPRSRIDVPARRRDLDLHLVTPLFILPISSPRHKRLEHARVSICFRQVLQSMRQTRTSAVDAYSRFGSARYPFGHEMRTVCETELLAAQSPGHSTFWSGLLCPKPPARAAWDDDEFVQPTFQIAVEEGDAF
jgi:hypothetical protein